MTVAEEVCAKLRGACVVDGCAVATCVRHKALADYIEAADALAAAQTSEESVDIGAILTRYNAALSRLREVMG